MAQKSIKNNHLRFIAYFFLVLAILIISRLFYLQIWEHSYYTAIASARHDKNQSLSAHRGTIYFKDVRTGELSVAALDKEYYTVIANPSQISFDMVDTIGQKLSEILDIHDPEDERSLLGKLSQNNLKYVVIARKVSEETKIKIDSFVSDFEEKLNKNKSSKDPYRSAGISTQPATYRFYPEGTLAASVLGFGVKKDEQPIQGQYGIEGFWNDILTGKQGVVSGEKSIGGSWITLAGRKVVQAKDGADVILTIDRTLEFEACKILQKKFEDSHAKDAALVIMNPKTGAILAMCSFPDFDPNNYGQVSSTEHFRFNNTAIFTPYEPGSVFKPITMAMALDLGLVTQNTKIIGYQYLCQYTIKGGRIIPNANGKCYTPEKGYPSISTTDVLINSINTGMVWVVQQLGKENFALYLDKFGLANKTGITLDSEVKGNIASITRGQDVNILYASFGQSITVTPLQLAMMYSALAHEGIMPRPYIVDSVRYSDGSVQKTETEISGQPISSRTSALITGMLVATANSKGYQHNVHVPGYEVAEKTGTAQIFEGNFPKKETNHTVTGFAPVNDPQIVMVVKIGEPTNTAQFAEGDAGPAFRDIMCTTLKYLNIPGNDECLDKIKH